MGRIILACRTLIEEITRAVEETGVDYPVKWVESGLHLYPDKLGTALQREIDSITNVDTVIVGYGLCGNALLGIEAAGARLVVPRVDDCISLLLGSYQARIDLAREMGTYFLTRGWLENESNIIRDYDRCLERYGEERTKKVFRTILTHYRRLALIDTGTYDLDDDYIKRACGIMERLGLETTVVKGSLGYIKQLLTGPWDESFVVVEPGGKLTFEDFMLDVSESLSNFSLTGFGKGGAE
jgi:hypothetical protein